MALDLFLGGPLQTMLRIAGIDVVYRRGGQTFELRLMPADQDRPSAVSEGLMRTWAERDWIGLLSGLKLDGVPIRPESGDEILVDVVDGEPGEIWQVNSKSGSQCWEPMAANRDAFRVHSVQVK